MAGERESEENRKEGREGQREEKKVAFGRYVSEARGIWTQSNCFLCAQSLRTFVRSRDQTQNCPEFRFTLTGSVATFVSVPILRAAAAKPVATSPGSQDAKVHFSLFPFQLPACQTEEANPPGERRVL